MKCGIARLGILVRTKTDQFATRIVCVVDNGCTERSKGARVIANSLRC